MSVFTSRTITIFKNKLAYHSNVFVKKGVLWCCREDLNSQPLPYEGNEPNVLFKYIWVL